MVSSPSPRERGVILIHVLILMMILGWLASMFLSAVLSRQVNAKQSMNSNEIRAAMNAAAGRITSCLGSQGFPASATCASVSVDACLGTPLMVDNRPFAYTICPRPSVPPCRIRVNVCAPGDASCPAPGCP